LQASWYWKFLLKLNAVVTLVRLKHNVVRFYEKEGPKIPPSDACCDTMRGLDVTCYCNKYVNSDFLKIISLEKALYVAQTCQAQNIPKDKCGSKLISLFLLILKIFDFIYYFIF
jgi:hypothetical protein